MFADITPKDRFLGPDASQIFPVGFGGMSLSEAGRPSEAEAIKVIHSVLDAGVNLLDLSNVYGLSDNEIGHNERLFSKALKSWGGSQDRIVVATKGGRWRYQRRWEVDARPSQLKLACENSLRDLGVERIDLYHLNTPDPNVPFSESIGALADLQTEGKIRWIGISNVDLNQIRIACSMVKVVTVQNRLNLYFQESIDQYIVKYCLENKIGFIAYHPVGGWLSKKLGEHKVLHKIGKNHGASPYAIAIAWELAQSPNIIPIPSAKTIEHALDSISGAGIILEPEEIKAINKTRFSTGPSLNKRVLKLIQRYTREILGG